MRNLKRALSLTLASVMLLGMMVMGTSAASFPDVDDNDNVEAIEVLNAVGVMIGDNGNFKPDQNVTRNEMAVIMAKLVLGTYEADSYVGTHPFTDVPSWADKYVAACYASGIVAGRSATTYDGQSTVTAVEAAAMMLRALGYEDLSKNAARWDQPVAAKANELSLFEGLTGNGNAAMNRNSVAKLALNTIQATMVTTVREGQDIQIGDVSISSNIRYVERENKSQAYGDKIKNDEYLQLGEYLYKGKLVVDDEADDYGMPATVWTYDGKEVISSAKAAEYVWTTGIEDITKDDLYKALGSKTGALTVYENGSDTSTIVDTVTPTKGATGDDNKVLKNYKGATIYAVDKYKNNADGSATTTGDPDGIVDSLIVVYPYLAKVTKVTDATAKAERKITMDVWSKADGTKLSGVTFETEDFAKDDYVLVFPGDAITTTGSWNATTMSGDILDVKPVETAVGKISAVSGEQSRDVTALTIDGTKYTVGGANMATKGLNSGETVRAGSYSFTSETTLYLSNGYILGAEGTNGAKDISNIVYAVAKYQPVGDYGVSGDRYVQVIRMDGTVENLKANSDPEITAGFYTISEDSGKYTFTPASAYSAINGTSVYFGTTTTGAEYTMKADDKTVSVTGATRAYLTENTRVLYVKDSLGDLKTSMVTGPVRQVVGAGSKVLLSQDGSSYVVEAIIIVGEKANASEEVVYVNSTPKDTLADSAKNYEYWDATTGEKRTVPVKNANTPTTGFATYSVDDDGYYKFTPVTVTTTKNADGAHVISQAITLYGNLLTEGTTLEDADASNATYINQTGDSAYDSLSLKDIADAMDLAGVAYVVDEKVVAIVVTRYSEDGSRATYQSGDASFTAHNATNKISIGGEDIDITSDTTVDGLVTLLKANNTLNTAWTIAKSTDGKDIEFTSKTENTAATLAGAEQVTEGTAGTAATITGTITVGAQITDGSDPNNGKYPVSFDSDTVYVDDNTDFAAMATALGISAPSGYSGTVSAASFTFTADAVGVKTETNPLPGGTFTNGKDPATAKYKLAEAADEIAAATSTTYDVTIDSKAYPGLSCENTDAAKIAAWVAAYNADVANPGYTAKPGAGITVILTANEIGVKGSNTTGLTGGTFTDGTAAS